MDSSVHESAAQSLKTPSANQLESVSAQSHLTHVAVYARGAEVTRVIDVPEVPEDVFELRIPGITAAADSASFRLDLGGLNREIISLRSELLYPREIGEFGETVVELERVEREISRVEALRSVASQRKDKLEAIQFAPGGPDDEYDATERSMRGLEIARAVEARIARYDDELVDLDDQLFELWREQNQLQRADAQASDVDRFGQTRPRREVIVRFSGGDSADFSGLKLTYVVHTARWWPIYRIDLEDHGRQAHVAIEAFVAQNTGEDWQNVRLSFATSDLASDARLPRPKSLRLGRAQPDALSGFRAPPDSTDALFASFDQHASRAASMPTDPQRLTSQWSSLRFEESEDRPTGEYDALGATPRPSSGSALGQEMQWEEVSASAPGAPAASDFMVGAMPPPGAPPPQAGAPPPQMSASRSRAPQAPKRAEPIPASAGAEPESRWLDFEALRMVGPDSERRGKLAVDDDPFSSETDLSAASDAARKRRTTDPAISRGSFDYRYDTDGLADVPSDGMLHRITAATSASKSQLTWQIVPREDTSVYRVAELENPHASPLLTGPVEVYANGGLITTTTIERVASGGSMSVGLGIDERIRAARNARIDEESAGLLGGKREVIHEVEIELRSNLGFDANVVVLDRIPVTNDDDVSVELLRASPGYQNYDQREKGRPIQGGIKWHVELAAGASTTVEFAYKIVLRSKDEIIGGNRRE